MKRLALLAALGPTTALAHAGDHGPAGPFATLVHALSAPDHLAVALAVLVLPVAILGLARSRRRK